MVPRLIQQKTVRPGGDPPVGRALMGRHGPWGASEVDKPHGLTGPTLWVPDQKEKEERTKEKEIQV